MYEKKKQADNYNLYHHNSIVQKEGKPLKTANITHIVLIMDKTSKLEKMTRSFLTITQTVFFTKYLILLSILKFKTHTQCFIKEHNRMCK